MSSASEVLGGGAPTAPATNGAAASNGAAPAAALWQWPDDVKGYVENKGWKDPGEVLRSYMGLEKFHGVPPERLIKLPGDAAAPEWSDVYGKLGRPEKPEDYGIEGAEAELLAEVHGAGLSKAQATRLAKFIGEQSQARQKKAAEEAEAKHQGELTALRSEWGQTYEQNLDAADRAVDRLGWSQEDLLGLRSALGTGRALKMLAQIGVGLGEHGFVDSAGGGPGGFGMSREAAQAKYAAMNADPEFQKRLFNDDKAVRMQAVQERDRIAQLAFPDA